MSLSALAFAAVLAAGPAAAQPADDTRPDPSPIPKAAPGVARTYDAPYRTDTFTFPLSRAGQEGSEVEYFVHMKAGATLVYGWSVDGLPKDGEFYAEFHGATSTTGPGEAVSYREGGETTANGALTAPFDGAHGWLFKNDSARPLTVKLTIAGFYELPSVRETMGIVGSEYVPWGPPDWPYRYGPSNGKSPSP
jgi:hypothetical protein